ncbi:tryptase-2-like isoform X3 [Odocoileus virginianus]|uniref:Tryptase-2-like isoform X3 n=1 Tax=Odocoileus virginianus TaxID=9874 RepID=A0ABM4HG13_ODOVR
MLHPGPVCLSPTQVSLRRRTVSILTAMRCGPISDHSFCSVSACFHSRKPKAPESYRVLLGSTQLYQHGPQSREAPVSRIVTHPDFEKLHPFGSDIAMLQLLSPVNFTSSIVPACLPAPGMKLPSNSSCWITGWGMLSEETPLLEPFHLQEGKVSFIENKFCNMLYGHAKGKNFSVHEDMLCAGDFSTGKSICHKEGETQIVGFRLLTSRTVRSISAVSRASQSVEICFGRPGDAHRREELPLAHRTASPTAVLTAAHGAAGPEAGSWAPCPPCRFPVHSQRCERSGCPAWPGLLTESAAPEGETKGSVPRAPIRCHPGPPFQRAEALPTEPRAGTLCLPACWTSIVPLSPLLLSFLPG